MIDLYATNLHRINVRERLTAIQEKFPGFDDKALKLFHVGSHEWPTPLEETVSPRVLRMPPKPVKIPWSTVDRLAKKKGGKRGQGGAFGCSGRATGVNRSLDQVSDRVYAGGAFIL